MASPYTPFPTFGGDKQGGGITTIKMNPAQVRFPTSSRPVSAQAPADVNPFAAIAPFLLQGIGSQFFQGDPSPAPVPKTADINEAYTLEDIQSEILKGDEARYEADKLYGPSRELSGWKKWARLAVENLPALAFTDPRELSAYTSTSNALTIARSAFDLKRNEFIGDYTTAQLAKVLNVSPAFSINDSSIARSAIEGPNGGFYILSMGKKDDKTVDGTEVPTGEYYRSPNWIVGEPPRSDTIRASSADSKQDWMTERNKLETAASSLSAATPIINGILENIMQSPEMTTTYIGPLLRFSNNLKAAGESVGLYTPKIVNGDDLNWLDQKTGKVSEAFLNGDVIPYYEQVLDPSTREMKMVKKELNFEKMFGSAGNDAEFRSAMINLAYLAAAANGQTGRTLSDKDLALHLEQLGASFGAGNKGPRNAPGAIRALNGWFNSQLNSNSIKMREHERNSLASDYRKEYGPTPWGERWLTGRTDERTGSQILYNIPQAWLLDGVENNPYHRYLMTLVAARKRYGIDAVKRDPIEGLDWEGDYYTQYFDKLDELKGPKESGTPQAPSPKKPRKSRSGVG